MMCVALGTLWGVGAAAWELLGQRFVLEFQAGSGSPLTQRLAAIAQRGTIDGWGTALLAVVLLGVALAGRRLVGAPRAGRTLTVRWLTALAACLAWSGPGTFVGDAALPFLDPLPLLALNVGGFFACLLALTVFLALTDRARHEPASPVLDALVRLLVLGLSAAIAGRFVLAESGGWRSLGRLAPAGAILVSSLIAAPMVSVLVDGFGRRVPAALRLPRAALAAVGVLLLACTITTAATFEYSPIRSKLQYSSLRSTIEPDAPNVVLVTIDTLRADHLSCYGYERPTSPFLDEVARSGARFDEPVAAAAWTKPATGTILTGLYPSRHGALYHGSSLQLPEGEQTLAEAFRNAGYATAGFVTNPNIKKVFEFDRGFQEYFDSPVEDTITLAAIRGSVFGGLLMRWARHQFNWKYENDVLQMNEHILSWLAKNRDQRFFLYLHYIDPHIPYSPPEPYKSEFTRERDEFLLFNDRKREVGLDLYDGEIRYVDEGLSHVADSLREFGLWDNTLFVVTSDHGEEFFEHGVLGHGFSLYQPVIRVPLLMTGPGVPEGVVVADPVPIVDLAATLVDLAGLGLDRLGDGRSFAHSLEDRAPVAGTGDLFIENEYGQDHNDNHSFVFSGVRSGRWKLVLTERNEFFPPAEYGASALYDLASDPLEQDNLIASEEHRPLIQRLLDRLEEHSIFLQTEGFRDAAPSTVDPNSALGAQLKALGYL